MVVNGRHVVPENLIVTYTVFFCLFALNNLHRTPNMGIIFFCLSFLSAVWPELFYFWPCTYLNTWLVISTLMFYLTKM